MRDINLDTRPVGYSADRCRYTLSGLGAFDYALKLRGCRFLVGKGSHEDPVADAAIVDISREPGVPRASDPLRRAASPESC